VAFQEHETDGRANDNANDGLSVSARVCELRAKSAGGCLHSRFPAQNSSSTHYPGAGRQGGGRKRLGEWDNGSPNPPNP
jgi:hypothetical protein